MLHRQATLASLQVDSTSPKTTAVRVAALFRPRRQTARIRPSGRRLLLPTWRTRSRSPSQSLAARASRRVFARRRRRRRRMLQAPSRPVSNRRRPHSSATRDFASLWVRIRPTTPRVAPVSRRSEKKAHNVRQQACDPGRSATSTKGCGTTLSSTWQSSPKVSPAALAAAGEWVLAVECVCSLTRGVGGAHGPERAHHSEIILLDHSSMICPRCEETVCLWSQGVNTGIGMGQWPLHVPIMHVIGHIQALTHSHNLCRPPH